MPKREPIWKQFQHWWPLLAVGASLFMWITAQVVGYAKQEGKIEEHEKRLAEDEQKNKEQDNQLTQQMVQNQLIQQSLGTIVEQLKDIKNAQHR